MTPNDKNYVDRLHNQQVNELNEIKNRLLILEGKTAATTDGNIRVEIDTDKIYDTIMKAVEDCLELRQKRRKEKYDQEVEKLRKEFEAKGEPYYSDYNEWRAAIYKNYTEFFNTMLNYVKVTDRRFIIIRTALLKVLGESAFTNSASQSASTSADASNRPSSESADINTTEYQTLLSSLPSGIRAKCRELRHRITHRIHTYFSGKFALYRGWTILVILLYSLFFLILLFTKIDITVYE